MRQLAMWPSYKERQERLGEAIELIRALWRGEEVTFEGKYYQTRKAKLFPPPASKIPLYISTVAPSSAAFAGKYGDGLFTLGGKQPDLYRQLLKNFEDGAREAGKDPSQMLLLFLPLGLRWRSLLPLGRTPGLLSWHTYSM